LCSDVSLNMHQKSTPLEARVNPLLSSLSASCCKDQNSRV
jgi:hypothetical protein